MSALETTLPARVEALAGVRFHRGTSPTVNRASAAVAVVSVLALAVVPFLQGPATTYKLTNLCALVVLASMWNLMAGFGGMVSVGLQAYIGIGAYALLWLTDVGLSPYLSVFVAAAVAAALAYPMSFVAFRLSGGYFAIGTWVMAEVCRLLVVQVDRLGNGAGRSLLVFRGLSPAQRQANVYWLSVIVLVVAIAGTFLLLRSRLGLGLTAVRDDPVAANSSGVRIVRARRVVFLLSAAGCGGVGALLLLSTLRVQPDSAFNITWTASMIFCVVIGGVGTMEGPILGAVIFFVMQDQFAQAGSWYLIVLGLVAMGMAMWLPQGLWGLIRAATRLSLFPTQYRAHRLGTAPAAEPQMLPHRPSPTEKDQL